MSEKMLDALLAYIDAAIESAVEAHASDADFPNHTYRDRLRNELWEQFSRESRP